MVQNDDQLSGVATDRRIEEMDKHYIYKAVKREIDKWNPYGLLPEAPHDEFDPESGMVARMIRYNYSVEKIARAVSKVFSEAFEPQYFTVDSCMDVAAKIKATLDQGQERKRDNDD